MRNYILTVDEDVQVADRHDTYGNYKVGAEKLDDAVDLLQALIGSGIILPYCFDDDGLIGPALEPGQCVRFFKTPAGKLSWTPFGQD